MSNFLDALSGAARSGVCQLLGVPEYINDALERINFFPFDAARRAIPNFWRNALCDTPGPVPNPPPFTGGQCQARYNYSGVLNNFRFSPGCEAIASPFSGGPVWGPLSTSVRSEITTNNLKTNIVRVNHFGTGSFPQSIPDFTDIRFASSSRDCPDGVLVSFNPSRVDGLPDNCGDPDPTYRELEPSDVTINQDITYNSAGGVSITIPVIFVYARAQIDARANIIVPFTANINGELNVTGNVNLNGSVNFNIGTAGGGGSPKDPRKSPCDDITLPDGEVPEDPTNSDKEPRPDRDREQVITGVLVTVNQLLNERASTIVQGENPDIYAPSLGHVNFLCRVGEISGGWTSDLPVKNRRNLIPCPWPEGAVEVRGTPQPGVQWTLTPVFGYAGIPVEYVV